ncbi:MAG: hypothetical protein C4320_06560, partial [Armatimonadota bacterium]
RTTGFGRGLEAMRPLAQAFFGLAVAATTLWSFLVPDAIGFQRPELARIFFWHFPCPILATGLLALAAYFSLRILRSTGNQERAMWDVRAVAAQELAFMFVLLTLATGILFSKVQWGAWWQNDPRQTSFLLVSLVYLADFVLRGALHDPERRIRQSAAYKLMAFGPAMFLTYVFPRLPQIAQTSFHPSTSIMQGQIHGAYAIIVVLVLVTTATLSAWVYRLRVRAELSLLADEYLVPLRRDSADPLVVRPVRLPSADRPPSAEKL